MLQNGEYNIIINAASIGKWYNIYHYGTYELAHLEMIAAICYQLTKDVTMEDIAISGLDKYYVDHTLALWPQSAGGIPFNACEFQSKGDVITDLHENLAADVAYIKEQHY